MPTDYLLSANTLFFLLYLLSFIYVVIFALKEYAQNHRDSFFLTFTAISTTSGIIWGMIKTFTSMEIPFYPFDYMFAFLGFAAFWFKRYDKKNVEIELPPLTIQPLVENAVQHGVLNKLNGGTICIRITEQQSFKKVAIIDNGVGISEEQLNHIFDETNKNKSGVGLINTNRRLKRIYPTSNWQ